MIGLLNIVLHIGYGGFALATVWGWFIVPLGVTPIVWWHASGLLSVFMLMSGGGSIYAAISAMKALGIDDKNQKYVGLFMNVFMPTAALGSGWVLKTFGPIVDAAL